VNQWHNAKSSKAETHQSNQHKAQVHLTANTWNESKRSKAAQEAYGEKADKIRTHTHTPEAPVQPMVPVKHGGHTIKAEPIKPAKHGG